MFGVINQPSVQKLLQAAFAGKRFAPEIVPIMEDDDDTH